jgi:hypothetical protein
MHVAAWAVLAVVLSAATVSADATTSPGKNSVYVSQLAASIDSAGTHAIAGSIAKGKSKTVLEVDVVVTDITGTNAAVGARVIVNGVLAEPSDGNSQVADCNSGIFCTLASQWWLDLDAAEAAHPGMFKGKQLVVIGDIFSNAATSTANISLRARMEKK